MKLYLNGHNFRYATEQMLLTLFPGERPEYPASPADQGENHLVLTLSRAGGWASAHALLTYQGETYSHFSRAPDPPAHTGRLERDRVLQRILKTAFYQAGTAALSREPPWGALTGVRPVKIPTKALSQGDTPQQVDGMLWDLYRVSEARRRLALDCAQATLDVRDTLEEREVSLYVGIPFCPSRCAYCSFISAGAGKSLSLQEPYLDALVQEVRAAGAALARAGRQVRSVYFGGGTPTTLSAQQLHRLLGELEDHIDLAWCGEYTVEAGRPDTITAEKLAALKAHGCTRVSVNPQTMSDAVLRAIGRAHTAGDFLAAWDLVRQTGFQVVNMDLIAGLPADSEEGFRASLDQILALGPENITVHTLALKKGSRLMEQGGGLPAAEEVSHMLDYAWSALREASYAPYYLYRQKYMSGGFENVGWCRPGTESLYNVVMMEELHTILSLGSGGVTKLIDPRAGSLIRLSNPKFPKEYISHISDIIRQKEEIEWPTS